jgi:hypothetical protein
VNGVQQKASDKKSPGLEDKSHRASSSFKIQKKRSCAKEDKKGSFKIFKWDYWVIDLPLQF